MSILLSIVLLTLLEPSTQPTQLADLGFIHGAWASENSRSRTEEFWSPPRAGTMLGASRTMRGDKTVFFEHFRIEQRDGEIVYVAQPGGRAPTEFKLTSFDGTRAVFENPQHDFPTRIIYEKIDNRTMRASIEGLQNGKPAGQTWEFKRF